ncbi:MAG TPA: hypothetical protein VGB03_05510, partial [Acidimicrobiales bacterium]
RLIRDGDELRDDDVVVVRGGRLDPEILRADALRNHAIYGTFGVSVFALRDATLDESCGPSVGTDRAQSTSLRHRLR